MITLRTRGTLRSRAPHPLPFFPSPFFFSLSPSHPSFFLHQPSTPSPPVTAPSPPPHRPLLLSLFSHPVSPHSPLCPYPTTTLSPCPTAPSPREPPPSGNHQQLILFHSPLPNLHITASILSSAPPDCHGEPPPQPPPPAAALDF
nr:vegetative cell wall protein gp1-like [Arachis hypogaea]